ncbi:MAG: DNA repair protein RadA [Spirochaetae bacterium HGW-Spirochaetae-7]|jgi:DNA repair protein RadA/Sms|nr:MAG: DNA repair protein RadA [Spirochaetae bacterium HGW-Spirochaetae-7]
MAARQQKPGYECAACGHREAKWLGRCPQCGEWNTLHESAAPAAGGRATKAARFSVPLAAIDPAEGARSPSGLAEVDRVLGGGIMRGSSVLVGGEPGIGKSTLLLQVAALAGVAGRVLYISGEESAAQIRLRADRLGLKRDGLEVLCTNDLAEALAALERVKPVLFFVDSLQTLSSAEAGAVPGTANQVKYCALELSELAREKGSSCFLVAHVTKDGLIAGPKAAEHIVDVVLMFEQTETDVRFLRSAKNRFGSTDEVGLFTMTERGLVELTDPSAVFLVRRETASPAGVAVAITWEGTRALLVEIQALTVPGKASLSRVYSERIEPARVARVAAVLEKHVGLKLSDHDIYVNVAGGIRLSEPGVDLALAAAIYSARTGLPLPTGVALAGELSLAGEARTVRKMPGRAKAAAAMSFRRVLGPQEPRASGSGLEPGEAWEQVGSIAAMIRTLFGSAEASR